jgi:hypothetical protein
VNVFVGHAEGKENSVDTERVAKSCDNRDGAPHADDFWRDAENFGERFGGCADGGMMWGNAIGRSAFVAFFNGETYRGRAMLLQMAAHSCDCFVRVLVGHQAAGELYVSFAGQNSFAAGTLVAAIESVDFDCGPIPLARERAVGRLAEPAWRAYGTKVFVLVKSQLSSARANTGAISSTSS